MVLLIMGVSGSGKSSLSKLLADRFSFKYIDADDHHPRTNIDKMKNGIPLKDEDRAPWLRELNRIIRQANKNQDIVLACSALKSDYRDLLLDGVDDAYLIYLNGSYETISERLLNRIGHFMKEDMLRSQFKDLEIPENADLILDIEHPIEELLKTIKDQILQ